MPEFYSRGRSNSTHEAGAALRVLVVAGLALGTYLLHVLPDRFKDGKTSGIMPNNGGGAGAGGGDIYHSKRKLATAMRRLQRMRNGDRAIEFMQYLQASGMSTIRVARYAVSMTRILSSLDISSAGRKEIEAFVADLNRADYNAWTKHDYKLTIKKLFQYLRYGSTSRETPYPEEVSWGVNSSARRSGAEGPAEESDESYRYKYHRGRNQGNDQRHESA